MLTQRRPSDPINTSNPPNARPGTSSVQGERYSCLYDFDTQEADQFSFKQNDVLTIVHKEPSGWWAAYLNGRVGWVPAAYLEPVRTAATINTRAGDGTRGLMVAGTSPNSLSSPLSSSGADGDLPVYTEDDDDSSYLSPDIASDNYDSLHQISGEYPEGPTTPIPSFSPTDPLVNDLAANFASASLRSGNGSKPNSRTSGAPVLPAYAIYSSQATSPSGNYNYSRDSAILYSMSPPYDPPIPHQLSLVLEEGSEVDSQWSMPHTEFSQTSGEDTKGKRMSVPVSTASSALSAAALHQARLAQASIPWYLRPKYVWEELKLDTDGSVIGGTVQALIERLLTQSQRAAQEQVYRTTFLTTFKTFTTSNHLFDTLIAYYNMEQPPDLNQIEASEWREKRLRPTQTCVLGVFSQWVEKHSMFIDDPQLVPKLRTFLIEITSPTALVLSAKQLLQTMDKVLLEDSGSGVSLSSSPPSSFLMRRKAKAPKGDFLKWDPTEVANQLTLMEARYYKKIRPQECLSWTHSTKGPAVANLTAFVGTSDRLAAWVKLSILTSESLGKRADVISHWIKIAERCRALNNIFSMSAIVAALSSGDIAKLHLTWAHVNRASNLEQLVRITDPTGNFSNYKSLHNSIDGACIPFISTFLTELMHINDQHPDVIPAPVGPEPIQTPPRPMINFLKMQRLSDAVSSILKFNQRTYKNINDNPAMTYAIEQQIETAASKDAGFFWQRSQELQGAEVTHADIWKNLNDAGF